MANAKKQVEKEEEKSLVRVDAAGSLAELNDMLESTGAGTESIGKDDVRPPRLMLAQALTPQVQRNGEKSIADLREGDFFNDLSEQIYGEGPIDVVFLSCVGARGVEFEDMNKGGGIIDANVPLNDPRMQFTADPEDPRKRVKPVATKFWDYLAFLPETEEFVSFSFKGTGLKVAARLNSLLKYPIKVDVGGEKKLITKPDAWFRAFQLTAAKVTKGAFTWYTPVMKSTGIAPREVRDLCKQLNAQYAGKNIIIPTEAGDVPSDADEMAGGDPSFDPSKL